MASPASAKKQLIESIRDKNNILVTVSSSPSVDELAAAIGLTLFLNKLNKHATAVASGEMPSAIDFLQPDKTFEATADSLRDFIIALDKEKADHLRYKLEGDVVKIFITPYKTTITQRDLEFSQGDYNVELVLALNVAHSDELDKALAAHGKILHNATVATLTAGAVTSELGSVDWHDEKASGVSEMIADLLKDLKTTKATVDEQISTALLTGIVATTERFSNNLTSPDTMTIAAELMALGANQQLIAVKLEEAEEAQRAATEVPANVGGPAEPTDRFVIDRAAQANADASADKTSGVEAPEPEHGSEQSEEAPIAESAPEAGETDIEADGAMKISHVHTGDMDDVARQVMRESQEKAARAAEEQLDKIIEGPAPDTKPEMDLAEQLRQAAAQHAQAPVLPFPAPVSDDPDRRISPAKLGMAQGSSPAEGTPSIGGTLNATTAYAAEERRKELEREQNRTILSHGTPMASTPEQHTDSPLNAAMAPEVEEQSVVDIFAAPPNKPLESHSTEFGAMPAPVPTPAPVQPEAPSAPPASATPVAPVPDPAPVAPAPAPTAPTPTPAASSAGPVFPTAPPASAGPVPAPDAPAPASPEAAGLQMPDFSSLPPLPPAPIGVDPSGLPPVPIGVDPNGLPPVAPPSAQQKQDFNPGQFQIPPQ